MTSLFRKPSTCQCSGGFRHCGHRWVVIEKKKKIALHRLVWMAANLRLIPDGFDVDHVHGKSAGNGVANNG